MARIAAAVLGACIGALPVAAASPASGPAEGAGLRLAWPAATERLTRLPAPAAVKAASATAPAADRDDFWRTVPPSRPDWRGARRDVTHFLSYQVVGVAVLYLMPERVNGWSEEHKKTYSFAKWRYNVTHPAWDRDAYFINYVLHPYWGGAYYTRARERGLDRTQSFWFSALMSVLWEYGGEALAERVSVQDLIVTPVLGSALGEYVFAPLRERIRSRSAPLDWTDKTLLALTYPFGAINDKIDQWFGLRASVQVTPNAWRRSSAQPVSADGSAPRHLPADGWSLQLRVDW